MNVNNNGLTADAVASLKFTKISAMFQYENAHIIVSANAIKKQITPASLNIHCIIFFILSPTYLILRER